MTWNHTFLKWIYAIEIYGVSVFNKLYCIADQKGRKFYHPLCPAVRYWTLATFDYKELKAYQEEKAKPKEIAPVKPDEDISVPETIAEIPVEEKPKRRKKNTKTTS